MRKDSFANIINLDKCSIDLSYWNYWSEPTSVEQLILTKENQEQVQYTDKNHITDRFCLVTDKNSFFENIENVGDFTFNYMEHIEGTDFDVEPKSEIVHLNFNDFKLSTVDFEFKDYKILSEHYYLKDVDLTKSLFYECELLGKKHILCLTGGFNNKQLNVMLFNENKVYGSNIMKLIYDGVEYKNQPFKYSYVVGDRDYRDMITDISVHAKTDSSIKPPSTSDLFTTFYITKNELEKLKENKVSIESLLMNVYTMPFKINDKLLVDNFIKVEGVPTIESQSFKNNVNEIKLFEFDFERENNINKIEIQLPYNSNVELDINNINGNKLIGSVFYEVDTNTTTLIIKDNVNVVYKNKFELISDVPFKLDKETNNLKIPNERTLYLKPLLILYKDIISDKENYLKGRIEIDKQLLKSEYDLLTDLISNGVYIND